MPPQIRCLCSSHRCGDAINTASGERGVLLDTRRYKSHQQDDRKQELRHATLEKNARILRDKEAMLSRALGAMTLAGESIPQVLPTPRTPSRSGQYRIEKTRKMIAHVSEIKDEISELQGEAESIGMASSTGLGYAAVHENLQHLGDIQTSASELEAKLKVISRGSREASFVAMRDETLVNIGTLTTFLSALKASWKQARLQLEERREAELAVGITEYNSSHHFQNVLRNASGVIQLVALMVVACHVILGFSRRGCHWLFSMTSYIIQTTAQKAFEGGLPPYFTGILSTFPRDVRTAVDQFNLEAKSTVYAACPLCHTTYKPSFTGSIPIYQERCTARRYGSRCKELLVRPKPIQGHRIYVPIRPYIAFDFKDWMAGLLSREGYEMMMDEAWDRMSLSPDGTLTDIFQGSAIREFKGPDGRTHFSLSGEEGAGRYLFSLSFDSFNPLGNKMAGKKISIGSISLVCLNLPIEIRYKPENMFLAGIVPGPKEPALDAINPYLHPIVDAFLEFWKGVRFTCTSLKQKYGRLILCAIIAAVCDLPAARKIGGFASFKHEYFCSACWCNKTQHTYDDINIGDWTLRTNEECRHHAEVFRTAATPDLAARSFDCTGLRWSELLRLPYFDLARFVVVDPMHNLFLGLIKEHFQNVLGCSPKGMNQEALEGGIRITIPLDSKNPLPVGRPEKASVRKLISWLEKPLDFESQTDAAYAETLKRWVNGSHLSSLVYVGRGLGCLQPTVGSNGRDAADPHTRRLSKKNLVEHLLGWRLQQQSMGDQPGEMPLNPVFTAEEMSALWDDIEQMIKPSWVTSVPNTVGSKSGSKLKADQWRTIGSLYLPVTLIRLWSAARPDNPASERRRQVLHLTMILLSAISIATSRATSAKNAKEYLTYMTAYRQELMKLFPHYRCHANHHMAMHIPEYLERYGPVHGWWAYPFERMIGMLQRISTNYKPGEYEKTIGRSWHQASNFRMFFTKSTCPPILKFCHEYFEKLVSPHVRHPLATDRLMLHDDLADDIDDDDSVVDADDVINENAYDFAKGKEERLTGDVRSAILERMPQKFVSGKAKNVTHVRHKGLSYTVRGRHEGNSGVLVKGLEGPFSIDKILLLPGATARSNVETWVVLRHYRRADVEFDPYLKYPYLRVSLWATDVEDAVKAVPISDLDTHFAKCLIPWEEKEVAAIVQLSPTLLVEKCKNITEISV